MTLNNFQNTIITQAVMILSNMVADGNHIEANFRLDDKTYLLTFKQE